jgi:hypothetical protein
MNRDGYSPPSNEIGAKLKGLRCGAPTRRRRAPLTVTLSGKRIVGTVGRVTRTDRLGAVPETA